MTIKNRLGELNPKDGEASLYRPRDLVPERLMPDLAKGDVLVINWQSFEPQIATTGGRAAESSKAGQEVRTKATIRIGPKTTTPRGSRYITPSDVKTQVAAGILTSREGSAREGRLLKEVRSSRTGTSRATRRCSTVSSAATSAVEANILVFNDEAHHAYRIRTASEDTRTTRRKTTESDDLKEATVWIDGLDKIHKHRGINLCVDLSATPYFSVGSATTRTGSFLGSSPTSAWWTPSSPAWSRFRNSPCAIRRARNPGLLQHLALGSTKLTTAERGGKRVKPKPEAVLKYAHTPIAMLGGLWEAERRRWLVEKPEDKRPPVYILICKTTTIAKVIYDWIADDKPPTGIPSAHLPELPQHERRSSHDPRRYEGGRGDRQRARPKATRRTWMRVTLDTVGKTDWPRDSQGRPIYPENFEALAKSSGGRCIRRAGTCVASFRSGC